MTVGGSWRIMTSSDCSDRQTHSPPNSHSCEKQIIHRSEILRNEPVFCVQWSPVLFGSQQLHLFIYPIIKRYGFEQHDEQ